jgi:hypothetical protein
MPPRRGFVVAAPEAGTAVSGFDATAQPEAAGVEEGAEDAALP